MRVKAWPREEGIPIEKCAHRFGAKMTFSFQTDSRFDTSIYALEMFGFRHNIRVGAFVTNLLGQYIDGIAEAEKSGQIRHDIYFGTDMWKNPVTNVIEYIPDYYETEWTEAGAAFFDVNIGESKITKTPNCGQQMFDISNGHFGYDFTTSTMGETKLEEFFAVPITQKDWLRSLVHRIISTASFRNGQRAAAGLLYLFFNAVRNSTPSPAIDTREADTRYGPGYGLPLTTEFLRIDYINYESSFRWWDGWNDSGLTKEQATAYMAAKIALTLLNSGWYRDFGHVHAMRNNGTIGTIDEFMSIARNAFGDNFVWTCSNGEAIEYLFIRELCSRVIAKEFEGAIVLIADLDDVFKQDAVDGISVATILESLNIPLSVQVDLSGTSLAGKNIVSSFGKLRKLEGDVYIAEIPFLSHEEGFLSVWLTEGNEGIFDESIPEFTYSIEAGVLTIETNVPTKATMFAVLSGGNDFDSMPSDRSNQIYKKEHAFSLAEGYDYRIGLSSDFGMSSLSDIITV